MLLTPMLHTLSWLHNLINYIGKHMKHWHSRVKLQRNVQTEFANGFTTVSTLVLADNGASFYLEDFIPAPEDSRYDAIIPNSCMGAIGVIWGADSESGVIQSFS